MAASSGLRRVRRPGTCSSRGRSGRSPAPPAPADADRARRPASYTRTVPRPTEAPLSTGIGLALRKARVSQGVTIEEAARDTRIRPEVLEGLEAERFERLASPVIVRGSLRTYAGYLGLPAEDLVERYRRVAEGPVEEQPVPEEIRPLLRERDSRLAILLGIALLVVAGAFGALSSRPGSPAPAELDAAVPVVAPADAGVLLAVTARDAVDVAVRVDGGAEERFRLSEGESRSFQGDEVVRIHLADGKAARVVVNGVDQGFPGARGAPWNHSFRAGDPELAVAPSPAPAATPSADGSPEASTTPA